MASCRQPLRQTRAACRLVLGLGAAALAIWACERPAVAPVPEPWASQPPAAWPPLTLANRIRVGKQSFAAKGGAFLVRAGSDTLVAAPKHLLLSLRSDSLRTVDFGRLAWSWTVFRRDAPADSAAVRRLLNADPGEELDKSRVVHRDWLLFELAGAAPGVQPLRPGPQPRPDQPVLLVGWDDAGRQVVHRGRVVQAMQYTFLLDLGNADVGHLSGAPIVDESGLLVGLYSGQVGSVSWANTTRYLQEILAQRTPAAR